MHMSKNIRLTRGLDIRLQGEPEKTLKTVECRRFALKPTDFRGVMPRLMVAPGDKVKAGSPLFHDKAREQVLFCSPVGGTVVDIIRGPKRVIEEILIECDGKDDFIDFGKSDPSAMEREAIITRLLESGAWPFILQRPYSVIANPADKPKAIFVSAFDTAPLAPDYDFIIGQDTGAFQTGIEVLRKLSGGKVHLNVHSSKTKSNTILQAQGVQINHFNGPHPAGNIGIQIHHIDPINKGEVVWYVNPQDLMIIGRIFSEGRLNTKKVYAVTGSELLNPHYVISHVGVNAWTLVGGGFKEGPTRMISGNVLTGTRIERDGYMGFYHHQFTAIPEGKYHEFLGWALPGLDKFSASRTYFSWLTPHKKYRLDTNIHGGERAYVVTGDFEKVLPMNIYPLQLIKAILADDIELMESLGIYEVDDEDFALCEVICTSKTEIQSIIRKGLDLMRKEMS
jgi:Na+-transporting NADH:ubiquinone oxidoreductase subunit A